MNNNNHRWSGSLRVYKTFSLSTLELVFLFGTMMLSHVDGARLQMILMMTYYKTNKVSRLKRLFSSRLGESFSKPSGLLSLNLETMEEMEEVGALLSIISQPPDVIFLDGDLGAGKTTFARGFIQQKLGFSNDNAALKITSPTYLLSNVYTYQGTGENEDVDVEDEDSIHEIHHMDIYRLKGTSKNDFDPLHLDHVFAECISLIEWPSRLYAFPDLMPSNRNRLDIEITIVPSTETRRMTLAPPDGSTWKDRLMLLLKEGMLDDLLVENDRETN